MGLYWELFNHEHEAIKYSYSSKYRDIYDLAITTWDTTICSSYFVDFRQLSAYVVTYKSQADIALKQAINSVLRKEYPQAMYNIRFAIENLVTTLFGYAEPETIHEFLMDREKFNDQKLREMANKFLEKKLPARSKKFKNLRNTFNQYGTHQGLGFAAHTIRFNPEGFELQMRNIDSPHLNVGIAGVIIGLILEFHFTINELESVEYIRIEPDIHRRMAEISTQFEAIKFKYKELWRL